MADPRVERLRRVPLFSACSDAELRFIASRADEVDVPAGRALCREGESGGEFFVLMKGGAVVERGGTRVRELSDGDFFGEVALLDHGPRSATVTTTAPSSLLVLSPSQFRDVMHQNSEIAVKLLHAVVARLRAQTTLAHD